MAKYEDLIAGEDALPVASGRAWVVGDGIVQRQLLDDARLAEGIDVARRCLLTSLLPEFAAQVREGDALVAGDDFGLDVTQRALPALLRAAGLSAVIARSIGAAFIQHALRCALAPLTIAETAAIKNGDRLRVDVEARIIANLSSGDRYVIRNVDEVMLQTLRDAAKLRRGQRAT